MFKGLVDKTQHRHNDIKIIIKIKIVANIINKVLFIYILILIILCLTVL